MCGKVAICNNSWPLTVERDSWGGEMLKAVPDFRRSEILKGVFESRGEEIRSVLCLRQG